MFFHFGFVLPVNNKSWSIHLTFKNVFSKETTLFAKTNFSRSCQWRVRSWNMWLLCPNCYQRQWDWGSGIRRWYFSNKRGRIHRRCARSKEFWNEHSFQNDQSIGIEAKDSKLPSLSAGKVEAWLSSNSKLVNKSTRKVFPKITEVENEKMDTTLSKGVAVKRKLVFEGNLPEPKKLKCSAKKSLLGSISGWVSGIFR